MDASEADQLGDENLASEQFDSPAAEAGDSQAGDVAQLEPVTDPASEA